MNDFLLLEEIKGQKHLLHDDPNFLFLKFDTFKDRIHERAVGLIFQHDADDILVFK